MRYLAISLLLATLPLAACGGGNGGGAPPGAGPTAPTKIAVVGDYHYPLLTQLLRGRGLTVDEYPGYPSSNDPAIDGDLVVWEDQRSDSGDIYAHDLSTSTEFKVSQDPGTDLQGHPAVSGNLVVWQDHRNGNWDIYAYDISTSTEFRVNQDAGTASQYRPAVSGTRIVWYDQRNGTSDPDIYLYDTATSTEMKVNQDAGPNTQDWPAISGDLVAWVDHRNGNADIYAYDLSTSTEFKVSQDPGTAAQIVPAVSGNLVVWYDTRNGDSDIYAYDLSTSTEFKISQDPGTAQQRYPSVSGDLVVWQDQRNGNWDIYAYRVSTATEFRVDQDPGAAAQEWPAVSGNRVVWEDQRPAGKYYREIYLTDLTAPGDVDLTSTNKATLDDLTTDVADYAVLVFGDELTTAGTLALFDAADAAGVAMLGVGTGANDQPLGETLYDAGRFGMDGNSDDGSDRMHVDVTAAGQGHAIFAGLDTSVPLYCEDTSWSTGDEQSYTVNGADPNAPADWTVLATLGSGMSYAGDPAIVEFTTPAGTTVLLDGSATTSDGYEYWTTERWDLLYNEVMYLLGK